MIKDAVDLEDIKFDYRFLWSEEFDDHSANRLDFSFFEFDDEDLKGVTILHLACLHNRPDIIESLLKIGAGMSINSPYTYTVWKDHRTFIVTAKDVQ